MRVINMDQEGRVQAQKAEQDRRVGGGKQQHGVEWVGIKMERGTGQGTTQRKTGRGMGTSNTTERDGWQAPTRSTTEGGWRQATTRSTTEGEFRVEK